MSHLVVHTSGHERIPIRLNRSYLLMVGAFSSWLLVIAMLNDGDAGTGRPYIDWLVRLLESIVTVPVVVIAIYPVLWMPVIRAARTVVTPRYIRQPGKLAFWRYTTVPLDDETRVKTVYGWDDPSLAVSSGATSIRLPMGSYDAETRRAIVELLRYPS